ncbi:MAG: hypothetical protein E3K37_01620 [Candidatus Kuenenia sp.]|nr:hypothetical protein [Candidatus Kuenenia hertensis]
MIMEKTFNYGDRYILKHIDSNTGLTVKEFALSEAEYKDKTELLLINDYMRENPGVSYSEALLAVQTGQNKKAETKSLTQVVMDTFDTMRNDMISEYMEQNKCVSYSEAMLAVSVKRPDLF